MEIEFTVPGKDAPGFLRRVKRAAEFQSVVRDPKRFDAAAVDALVAFLADYVTKPADRPEAVEALLDASADQFNDLLAAITTSVAPLSTPTNGTS